MEEEDDSHLEVFLICSQVALSIWKKRRVKLQRERSNIIKETEATDQKMNVSEVSSYNVQTLRPFERPQEVTKKLAGTIIGLRGSRYRKNGSKDDENSTHGARLEKTRRRTLELLVVNTKFLPTCNVARRLDPPSDLLVRIVGVRLRRRDEPYDFRVNVDTGSRRNVGRRENGQLKSQSEAPLTSCRTQNGTRWSTGRLNGERPPKEDARERGRCWTG